MLVINASTVSLVQILKLDNLANTLGMLVRFPVLNFHLLRPTNPYFIWAKFDICINSTKNPHLFVDIHELLGGGLVGKIISDSLTEP